MLTTKITDIHGKDLKLIRLVLGMTRKEFAERLGYCYDYIVRLEQAKDEVLPKRVVYSLNDSIIHHADWAYQLMHLKALEVRIRNQTHMETRRVIS